MILQLREIFQIEGMHLPVDYTISLEELSEVRGYTFAAPVSVQGEFSNRAGIVTLKYTVSCTLDAVCDRCLAELRGPNAHRMDVVQPWKYPSERLCEPNQQKNNILPLERSLWCCQGQPLQKSL